MPMKVLEPEDGFISKTTVKALTGLPNSSLYALLDPKNPSHDPTFPRQFRISRRRVAWLRSEVLGWMEARLAARDGRTGGSA